MQDLNQLLKKTKRAFNKLSGKKNEGSNKLEDHLSRAQTAWYEQMQSYKSGGIILFPNSVPRLTNRHLKNCRLLANRSDILRNMKKGCIAAEVGVQAGLFSASILSICEPKELYLLDTHLYEFSIHHKYGKEIEDGIVHLRQGDSSTSIRNFPDNYFDFLYIDADHSYNGVKRT